MAEKNTIKVLRIKSAWEGFRRCGHAFGKEPVDIPLDELTRQEIKLLKEEPMLAVVEAEIDAPQEAAE